MPLEDQDQYPPREADGSIRFSGLRPEHRREYLDGWGHATVACPPVEPSLSPEALLFFRIGAADARRLTKAA